MVNNSGRLKINCNNGGNQRIFIEQTMQHQHRWDVAMKIKYRINPIFSELIPTALYACNDILFDRCSSCPRCGGSLAGYDVKTKHFADIIEGHLTKTVIVRIKRFRCSECGMIVYADQPFYPNTRTGSPVVDLCVVLSTKMPYARAATCLREFGLNVDRWSVRNYAIKNPRHIQSTELYGILLPKSIISLAALTSNSIGTSVRASDVLSACGYPSSQKPGAAPEMSSDTKEIDYTRFFPSLCCD